MPQNGATSGATLEPCRGQIRMNTRSAPDWEVMIEYVTGSRGVTGSRSVSGPPGQSRQEPQIVDSTGVLVLWRPFPGIAKERGRRVKIDALRPDPADAASLSRGQSHAIGSSAGSPSLG